MKNVAIATIAVALSLGATAGNAFASGDNDRSYNATVISADADRGILTLDNGWTLDSSIPQFSFPTGAGVGDKVRVNFEDDHDLKNVRVIG